MALATITELVRIPLGERPQYGQPYPEGLAVAAVSPTENASGGAHTVSIIADPGFLYRLELVNWTRGEPTARSIHCVTVHRWAESKAPVAAQGFDLNWILLSTQTGSAFSVYTLDGGTQGQGHSSHLPMIGRFPMGSQLGGLAPGVAVQIMLLTNDVNTDTITNEIAVVATYWKKESLYLPGFLSSFHQAPAVPPLVRLP